MLKKLHAGKAFVVGAVQRPPSVREPARAAHARFNVRAASANSGSDAAVEREAKFYLHSTLQVCL